MSDQQTIVTEKITVNYPEHIFSSIKTLGRAIRNDETYRRSREGRSFVTISSSEGEFSLGNNTFYSSFETILLDRVGTDR